MLDSLVLAPAGLDVAALERAARPGLEHRRLPRIDGAERSPSGQASCRHCREPIAKGTWRIRLAIFDEGRFNSAGYVHLTCASAYFETGDIVERLLHFAAGLDEAAREDLRASAPAPK